NQNIEEHEVRVSNCASPHSPPSPPPLLLLLPSPSTLSEKSNLKYLLD
ncbi:hypothetical protein A2U01_0063068, partial [Trifolium medium]|nr:hypothetical protein [Trifolium medium]